MAQVFNANVEILGTLKARGFDFQPDVLNIQTDGTLDPGATPATGARYIITDSGTAHANFGGIGDNNDIVEYDGTAFFVFWDASSEGEGALTWDRNSDKFYRYDGTAWAAGTGESFADLSDTDLTGATDAHIVIYDDTTDKWESQILTGDVTMDKDGATSIGNTKVTDAMLAGSISDGKLASDYIQTSEVDGTSIEFAGSTLNVKALGVTDAMLAGSISDGKMASDYVQTSEVDDSSIEWSGTALQVKAAGVTNAMLAGSITDAKLDSDYIQTSEVDGSSIEFAGSTLNVKALGVTDAMLAGSISFSKLADSANIARLDQTETVAAIWDFGSNLPTLTADPTTANQAVRKSYVDGLLNGLSWKSPVRVATSTNTTLSAPGANVDGVAMSSGERVLLTGQSTGSENGLWEWNGAASAMTRPSDFDGTGEADSAAVFVAEGTSGDEGYTQTAESVTIDTTAQTWVQFTGTGSITAGTGLTKSGSTINAIGGDGITANADDLEIDHDGNGLTFVSNQLALELDGSTLAKSASGLKVDDYGIDTLQLADDAVGHDQVNFANAGLRVQTVAWTNAQGTTKTITHNWLTKDIMVEVMDSDYNTIYVDSVTRTSTSVLTLTAISAPPSGEDYRVLLREMKPSA